ncbi:hypothetical protein UFOVP130_20 [uncultured Caudovirales phage]|uniref:Uncharacterized protein n=1 Tax=uncultured Caudovirales phage TaxID=2100421 RepID=A0A6J5LCE3_9CAUD|nr:hypothetical protein UFOVP130_20 [uncultured Caudovirales phage]
MPIPLASPGFTPGRPIQPFMTAGLGRALSRLAATKEAEARRDARKQIAVALGLMKVRELSRSNIAHLAAEKCPQCKGTGVFKRWCIDPETCNCVYRAVAKQVLRKYRVIDSGDKFSYQNRPRMVASLMGITVSRPASEFICDVLLAGRKAIDRSCWGIFENFLLGYLTWRDAAEACGKPKGEFFAAVARIHVALGKTFIEQGVFPMDEYFSPDPLRPTLTPVNLRSSSARAAA